MNTFDVLKKLTDVQGVAGNESAAAKVAFELLDEIAPTADITLDRHGSVVGFIGDERKSKKVPTILLDAHIDQVGLIVTHIDDKGFIKAEPCGGIDRRALAAQSVTIHAKSPIKGVICTLPPHVNDEKQDKVKKADEIRIDAGFSSKGKAEEVISLGDVVTIDGGLVSMLGKVASGVALDNRAGMVAILYALHLLKDVDMKYNIAVSFSVQEELGCQGAGVVAYNTEPDYAIVVDVSYGTTPGCSSIAHKCGELGKGPMIGYAPTLNREMFERLKQIAEENEIPYQLEIMGRDTGGTNADSITTVKGGVRTALISIPLRYMHTAVETADLSDIEAAGKLIAKFVENFEGGFFNNHD